MTSAPAAILARSGLPSKGSVRSSAPTSFGSMSLSDVGSWPCFRRYRWAARPRNVERRRASQRAAARAACSIAGASISTPMWLSRVIRPLAVDRQLSIAQPREQSPVGWRAGQGIKVATKDAWPARLRLAEPFIPQERLDLRQPLLIRPDARGDLGLAQAQHAAQRLGREVLGEQRGDLLEREPQVLEGDDPVQARELRGGVEAVAAGEVDAGRLEQADLVVVAQHLDGYARQAREVPDLKHAGSP